MADWLCVSQTTLSRIEQGRRRLAIDEISGFARALGIAVAVRWSPQDNVGEDVDPISRRSLFGAGVGAAVGLSATTAPAATREIAPELVSHRMKLLRVLGQHGAVFGPHDVLDTVRPEIDMIAQHRQLGRRELRTQLLGVESRWAWLASWPCNDAGNWQRRDFWASGPAARRAIRMIDDALDVRPRDRVRGLAVQQARLALACSAAGEPERAAVRTGG